MTINTILEWLKTALVYSTNYNACVNWTTIYKSSEIILAFVCTIIIQKPISIYLTESYPAMNTNWNVF